MISDLHVENKFDFFRWNYQTHIEENIGTWKQLEKNMELKLKPLLKTSGTGALRFGKFWHFEVFLK